MDIDTGDAVVPASRRKVELPVSEIRPAPEIILSFSLTGHLGEATVAQICRQREKKMGRNRRHPNAQNRGAMSTSRTPAASRLLKILIAVFPLTCAALLVWWTFHIPREPERLYRAVPAEASLVIIHDHPYSAWTAISTNPALQRLARRVGVARKTDASVLEAIRHMKLAKRDAKSKMILAYIPSAAENGGPALIASSWMGSASILLRWMLMLRRFPEFREIGRYAGWSIWGPDESLTDSGMKLSIAAGEGMLLACLSKQRDGVRRAIAAYEGLMPSSAGREQALNESETSSPNRGWLKIGAVTVSFRIDHAGQDALTVVFRIHRDICGFTALDETADMAVPERLLGDIPAVCAACSMSTARVLLSSVLPSSLASLAANLLDGDELRHDTQALILAVLTGDYDGGFGIPPLRARIPTVIVMFRENGKEPHPLVGRLLDDLNSAYRAGLIIRPDAEIIGNYRMNVIEPTDGTILSGMDVSDRPAYALCEDWLIISSNARALSILLTRFQNPKTELRRGDWQAFLSAKESGAFAWLDLDAAGKALRLPLVLWSFQTGSSPNARKNRRHLERAGRWLEEARSFGSLALTLSAETSQPVVRMTIKPNANSEGR